jgi:hypothetical protein
MAPPLPGGGGVGVPGAPPLAPPTPAMSLPPRPQVVASVKMKRLHWKPVAVSAVTDTLWKKLSEDDHAIAIDESEFEGLFCQAAAKRDSVINDDSLNVTLGGDSNAMNKSFGPGSSGGGGGGGGLDAAAEKQAAAAAGDAPQKVKLIDAKRSYRTDIALSRFRGLTHEQIRTAIVEMDGSVLTTEKLGVLRQCVPTDEETAAVTAFAGDVAALPNVERFFLCLSTVPHVEARLSCVALETAFATQAGLLERDLGVIESACGQLSSSNRLQTILQVILRFGNYMNGGTHTGQAYGFKLCTLGKLKATKSADNKTTLFHYVLKHLQSTPAMRDELTTQLSAVKAAAQIDQAFLAKECAILEASVRKVDRELEWIDGQLARGGDATGDTGDGDDDDGDDDDVVDVASIAAAKRGAELHAHSVFKAKMTGFHASAALRAKAITERNAVAVDTSAAVMRLFAADVGPTAKWEDFFAVFDKFCDDYRAVQSDIERARKQTERQERAAAQRVTSQAKAKKRRSATTDTGIGFSAVGSPGRQTKNVHSMLSTAPGASTASSNRAPLTKRNASRNLLKSSASNSIGIGGIARANTSPHNTTHARAPQRSRARSRSCLGLLTAAADDVSLTTLSGITPTLSSAHSSSVRAAASDVRAASSSSSLIAPSSIAVPSALKSTLSLSSTTSSSKSMRSRSGSSSGGGGDTNENRNSSNGARKSKSSALLSSSSSSSAAATAKNTVPGVSDAVGRAMASMLASNPLASPTATAKAAKVNSSIKRKIASKAKNVQRRAKEALAGAAALGHRRRATASSAALGL